MASAFGGQRSYGTLFEVSVSGSRPRDESRCAALGDDLSRRVVRLPFWARPLVWTCSPPPAGFPGRVAALHGPFVVLLAFEQNI